ncbi:unnamed protein product [Haemonchus placei]|uniref:Reverse transcriptase domain-containing protein n=1 Tax=Haemonchus placei TaxID=6290 RepID=A0A0N4WF90_HAEPC|nr:unnamed protein product [Haemonchus placei]
MRMLRELYDNFENRISSFYEEFVINVKRSVRQGDTILPKPFSEPLPRISCVIWNGETGVNVDSRYLRQLRFADDVALVTPNIELEEWKLAEFDSACGYIGVRLNLTKTMSMKNVLVPNVPCAERNEYLRMLWLRYLGREGPRSGAVEKGTRRVGSN